MSYFKTDIRIAIEEGSNQTVTKMPGSNDGGTGRT